MQPNYLPRYRNILSNKILQNKVEQARKHLTNCNLCPHNCGVNRQEKIGFCRATDKVVLSSYGPHMGEEPPLVGRHGSGTIFFGYCNMRCVFCQNCELSFGGEGELITNEQLADIMLELQNFYKCHNINLVTPTHFVPNILEALLLAAEKGLILPLVYNCGGYEKIETLQLLDDVIAIYMPDFKYHQAERGKKYSGIKDYPAIVKKSLKEMDRQVGGLKTDNQGVAYQGLIVRHLAMPGGLDDTKVILKFIKDELSPDCLVNLMGQYFPAHQAYKYEELAQRLSPGEYQKALDYAKTLGLNLIRP
ncbi:putative pyruvate formate lyase activating enzyme [Desulfotomaculum arcticum]|uniref:Putative pyruvate formate lyase activating enzyme n=1 Tax=Desulfotruncus arcticus DSM 17038 TaxID=1121424 RepID=A0A1I2RD15_9FIRM|nr:radical SAM protein [Desulfotruncus arcticus]SFG38330.1 putative pyruvate formate lyase activating enzyme [Desulfotomaculum arcticum] [Desulfotruncus arcticus DSM 17038]